MRTSHHSCPFQGASDLTRRTFLAGCAACTSASGAIGRALAAAAAGAAQASSNASRTRIGLVFTHIPPDRPTWPNVGYDYEGRKRELADKLRQACPDIEWVPATAHNADEAKQILNQQPAVDGYLVYLVGIWSGAPRALVESGRPVVLVDDFYAGSGEFLIEYARAKREGRRVTGVSSSRFEDVVAAAQCLACTRKLRESTILAVTERKHVEAAAKHIGEVFGTTVKHLHGADLNKAYESASLDEARPWAERWIAQAEKVVEPSREEIEKSARMYLGMRSLMDQHNARAITVDCLGLFYAGLMSAYPCLGFWELNNNGAIGACECDLDSTITMLAMTLATGRPGYISDPVVDTATNQVIYAHCVAPTKVFGQDGPTNPYHIRSHSEDRKGACIRSLLPLGEMTTTLKFFAARHEVIVHQGTSVANIDDDKACRTKLAVEVADADKVLEHWDQWGWHRVTFYGDLRPHVEHLSRLLGVKVVQEG